MIDGVTLTPLSIHRDERGAFCEVARASQLPEPPVQLSHSFMHAGVAKAWHIHVRQWDYWYLVTGRLKVVLYDMRFGHDVNFVESLGENTSGASQELILGDEFTLLHIPPGVAHGCKALSDCHLIYLTSREYDGTDEGRIAHDDLTIGYDWEKGPEIR